VSFQGVKPAAVLAKDLPEASQVALNYLKAVLHAVLSKLIEQDAQKNCDGRYADREPKLRISHAWPLILAMIAAPLIFSDSDSNAKLGGSGPLIHMGTPIAR
jgi:hypothetical protein